MKREGWMDGNGCGFGEGGHQLAVMRGWRYDSGYWV